MGITANLEGLRKEIPPQVTIIAVSKTMPAETVKEAYDAGQRAFGENKVQELTIKHQLLPDDIEWHLIGHLQTNKVKYIVPFVHLIHSVDSMKLLSEINREAGKINRVIDCLLQIHIAREESKFGLSPEEAIRLLNSGEFRNFRNIRITGLMGMATFTEDQKKISDEFKGLADFFREIQISMFSGCDYFRELSMGMSGDYQLAIHAGATMVRIGSLIFGERNYKR
jgi:pyridoxal phosphate enzyme (YggS family)